jgi:predicted small lipoprotein YifL
MKWMVILVVLLGLCGCNSQPLPFPRADQDASGKLPNTIGAPVDAGSDALPCAEQPCEPDDAGRCQRCPLED